MSTHADDDENYETIGVDAVELEQYGGVRLDDGAVIIYDTENEDAWVQSKAVLALDVMV